MTETKHHPRLRVLNDIATERERQIEQWGPFEHDDRHDWYVWLGLLMKDTGKLAGHIVDDMDGPRAQQTSRIRTRLITIAALCVAEVEAIDRGSFD